MDDFIGSDRDYQFVTLGINQEIFAVPVECVQEILDMRPVFRVPDAPPYLIGLMDVRGRGVPVIDLRLKLGLQAVPDNESTRVLVLTVRVSGRQIFLGLRADRVFEVATLNGMQIEPPPDIGTNWRSDYIHGVGRHSDSFVIIFNLDRLFSADEVAYLGKSGRSPEPEFALSA